jgi:hydrogenase maturation protease
VFFHDDGFGVAVARHLMQRRRDGINPVDGGALANRGPPAHVFVRDVGIRGLHLAYELLEDWDLLVAVDAVAGGEQPGTLHLIQPGIDLDLAGAIRDAHGMDLRSILLMARSLGASIPDVLVVGCDVADVSEGIGLTSAVETAVERAARMVLSIVEARACTTKTLTSAFLVPKEESCS